MRYSAAVLGILLSLQVVCVESGEGNVKHTQSTICAVKGSTVTFGCTYTHPTNYKGQKVTVTKRFWFVQPRNRYSDLKDLSTDPRYAGRVRYHFDYRRCTMSISNVTESDSAQYNVRFTTDHTLGSYSGESAVTLTVTDLEVSYQNFYGNYLSCKAKCEKTPQSQSKTYIWYKSGQRLSGKIDYYYYHDTTKAHSYSCAVKGNEHHPSPSVCVTGLSCNWVKYRESQMCAPKGSSVEISCTYNVYRGQPTSEYWFSQALSQLQSSYYWAEGRTHPRINVRKERKGSTLIITNVTDTDSAQYRFIFYSHPSQWGVDFPGTNLIVTDVKVVGARLDDDDSNEADVMCQTSCSPPSLFSYVWFLNGQEIEETTYSLKERLFSPGDSISCALQGYPQQRSPPVYALPDPTVTLSPGDIVEGGQVTLTCTTSPSQTVNYNWYKKGANSETPILRNQQHLVLHPIRLSDSGEYYCTAGNELGNKTSVATSIDVNYSPKSVSVLVGPSSEVMVGSVVQMNCSSSANPVARYTWYKENDDLPQAWGPSFVITNTGSEHSGKYYCHAWNTIGHKNVTVHLLVMADKMTAGLVGSITLLLLVVLALVAFLLIRRKRAAKPPFGTGQRQNPTTQPKVEARYIASPAQGPVPEQQEDVCYSTIAFEKTEDPIYSNVTSAQPDTQEEGEEDDDGVEYSLIVAGPKQEEAVDTCAIYSTVNKNPRE